METVPCPISGTTEAAPFLEVSDRFAPENGPAWTLVRNTVSGLIYLSPRPAEEEMRVHYPESGYDPHLSPGDGRNLRDRLYLALRRRSLARKASLIERGGPPLTPFSNILEVGCSGGDLLGAILKRNPVPAANCRGYESDERSASRAKERFGIDVRTADISESPPAETFDRIIFWHTLEHIHRLNETLGTVARCLKENGALIVTLPNPESLDAATYGRHWIAWDAPRHLYHFTPETLGKLLRRYGLKITSMHPFIPDTLYNCIHSEELVRRAEGGLQPALQARGLLRALRSIAAGSVKSGRSSTLVYTVVHE